MSDRPNEKELERKRQTVLDRIAVKNEAALRKLSAAKPLTPLKAVNAVIMEKIETFLVFLGVLLLISTVLPFGYQAFMWLKYGEWIEMPFVQFVDSWGWLTNYQEELRNNWIGVATIFDWLLELHVSIWIALLGWLCLSAFFYILHEQTLHRSDKGAKRAHDA